MRKSIVSLNGSLLKRFIGIAAALLVALSFAPDLSAQGCTNLCPNDNWSAVRKEMVEYSPGCWVEVEFYTRSCNQVPDFFIEVYFNKITLVTTCTECETEFNAAGITGLINDAIQYALGAGNRLSLPAGGDLTISWPKCWVLFGNEWRTCGDPPCCEREILGWTPGTTAGTSTSDPATCAPTCTTVCQ